MVVTIKVKDTDTGGNYTIKINNIATFDDVINALLDNNIDVPDEIKILKNKMSMEIDKQYTFTDNESISMVNRANLQGFSLNFTDVTKKRTQELKVRKTNNGCGYRYVTPGINLYGICNCKTCKAYDKEVIERIYKDELDLTKNKGRMHCPICNTDIECITVGFYKCYYNIYGMKYNEESDENEKFGKKIPNFDSITVNTDDTVMVNGDKYRVDKTNGENLSKFEETNGKAIFIKLVFQVKKF